MCLTIPKKVIEIKENFVIVETHTGDRQELKTLIELTIGDFVISQQNIVIDKMQKEDAEYMLGLINNLADRKDE